MTSSAIDIRELYQRYGAAIYRRSRRLLASDAEALAALHEVFLQVVNHYDTVLQQPSPLAHIAQLTTLHCLRQFGGAAARQRKKLCMDALRSEIAPSAMLSREHNHMPTPFELQRYLLGELSQAERQHIEALRCSKLQLQAALQAMADDVTWFTRAVPYAAFRIEHERRKSLPEPSIALKQPFIPALLAAFTGVAALLLWVMPPPGFSENGPGRTKATRHLGAPAPRQSPQLQIFTAESPEPLNSGAAVANGSSCTLVVVPPENGHYWAVLSIHGSGEPTLHFPKHPSHLAPLPTAGQTPVAIPISLSHQGRATRFFAVFAAAPLSLQPVLTAARRVANRPPDRVYGLALAHTYQQGTVWLQTP